jgi:hypothetical protein
MKILIVPFDPLMYMNDIDRDIAKQSTLGYEEIRDSLCVELDRTVGNYLHMKYNAVAPYHMRLSESKKDMTAMHSYISFTYEKCKGKAERKTRTVIKGGQISNTSENNCRYMAAKIKDQEGFDALVTKYKAFLVVFINQFEIKNDFASPEAASRGEIARRINVHYSIVNAKGKHVDGGIATTLAPSQTNNIKLLSNENFTNISYDIMKSLEQSTRLKTVTQTE